MQGWDDPDRRDAALERILAQVLQPDPLTKQELAVVFLASHGIAHPKAAEMMHLSESTIESHSKRAKLKLAARTHAHTVATALRLGLID